MQLNSLPEKERF